MPAKPSRLALRLILAALALLLLVPGLGWFWLAARLEAGLAGWTASRRAEGWQVAHAAPRRSGWPWAARLHLTDVALVEPGGLGWQAARLELSLRLPWPSRLHLAASGAQALTLGPEHWPLSSDSLTASLPLLPGPPAELRGQGLRLETLAGPLALGAGELRLAPAGPGARAEWRLEALRLSQAAPGLGAELALLAGSATLTPLPPAAASPAQSAAAWQAAGGQLSLPGFELRWGPLHAGGSAELVLDPALQPAGRATLSLAGLPETLEALNAAGLLAPRSAAGLRAMALLLQRPDPAGGPPRVQVPLTLADRRLALAGFSLFRLGTLRWPGE